MILLIKNTGEVVPCAKYTVGENENIVNLYTEDKCYIVVANNLREIVSGLCSLNEQFSGKLPAIYNTVYGPLTNENFRRHGASVEILRLIDMKKGEK